MMLCLVEYALLMCLLEVIPEEKVRRMRERILEMAPRVMYMERGNK
jgi:hypothetical protein